MLYQMTLLETRPGLPKAPATVAEWLTKSPMRGTPLACWQSELGVMNQILLLHGYEDPALLSGDREGLAQSTNRYGLGDGLVGASTMTYRPFPHQPKVEPGSVGPVFEVRSYLLRVGGLAPVIETWSKALPARIEISKPLAIMYSMDGPGPRLVHIWPYKSLEERDRIRTLAREKGIWPPRTAEHIAHMQTEIFLPAPGSPVR